MYVLAEIALFMYILGALYPVKLKNLTIENESQ